MGISLKVFLKIFVLELASSRSLAGIAGIVAAATLISKVFGLVRTQAIALTYLENKYVNPSLKASKSQTLPLRTASNNYSS